MRGVAHHLLQHEVELDRLEIEIGFGFELGVDRSEVVLLIDLQAMAGIIEEADIGAAQLLGESPDALLHVALAEIDAFDHIEAERRAAWRQYRWRRCSDWQSRGTFS